jgi:hypothetical protein
MAVQSTLLGVTAITLLLLNPRSPLNLQLLGNLQFPLNSQSPVKHLQPFKYLQLLNHLRPLSKLDLDELLFPLSGMALLKKKKQKKKNHTLHSPSTALLPDPSWMSLNPIDKLQQLRTPRTGPSQ